MPRFPDSLRYLGSDLLQIFRSFTRRPALVAVSIFSLALGIGANAALFSVADAVLFSSLPYDQPNRVVRLWETFQAPGGTRWTGSVSLPNLVDWRHRSKHFEALSAYTGTSINLTSGGLPERVSLSLVDADVFDVLGVPAALGRVLTPADAAGDGRVVVLSHELWRDRFGADAELVNGTISLGGSTFEVAGVMPAGFQFPPKSDTALWQPLQYEPRHYDARSSHWLNVVGRLAEGSDVVAATAEMEAIGAQLAEEYAGEQANRSVKLMTLQESVIGDARPVILALWGAVGFVLLIASGNVGHLLMARSARRRQEFAVRSALGAGRGQLARRVLLESLVLAATGAVAGLALGRWAVAFLADLPGSSLPASSVVSLDLRVFAYALAASFIAALLAGALPAWSATRVSLRSALGSARSSLGRGDRLRGTLVVAEVALALVVTLGAALMVRSLISLSEVDTGLHSENVLTLRLPVSQELHEEAALPQLYGRFHQSVATLPGVHSAGWINILPLQDWGWNGKVAVAGQDPPGDEDPWVEYRVVAGDYFESMGIPLLGGRVLGPGDDAESPNVVMINQTLAERYWGDAEPVGDPTSNSVGARIGFGGVPDTDDGWLLVVGVVGDVRNASLATPTRPEIYFPFAQSPHHEMSLVVSTQMPPETLIEPIRRTILEVDPLQPIYRVRTMRQVLSDHVASRSFDTLLLSVFAGLALLLAIVGVYSVMSHDVSRRRSEIGLRMALGANRHGVVGLFLGRGVRLALAGAACGAVIAALATRLLENRLYGVAATDPATYGAGVAALVLVAAVACAVPALRASQVHPTEALRDD